MPHKKRSHGHHKQHKEEKEVSFFFFFKLNISSRERMQLNWGEMHLCVCVLIPHALPGTFSCEQLWLGFPARRSGFCFCFVFLTH